jgi:hypothetical protein
MRVTGGTTSLWCHPKADRRSRQAPVDFPDRRQREARSSIAKISDPRKMEAVMSKPMDERFGLRAYDERVKLLLLVLFGVALATVVGFGLLVEWAN